LVFNRLSIIDIAHSHQPLRWGPPETPDRYVLVFTQIYNYLELLSTDLQFRPVSPQTATARHYRGLPPLGHRRADRLRGMFAFRAVGHHRIANCFCARDPFGIKPLSWRPGPVGQRSGSEKKCLLDLAAGIGVDLGIDDRAVQHYTVLAVRA